MLEDSITSSPHKNNRSIHKARLQRKIKRRCGPEVEEYESGANECDANKTEHATTSQAAQERVPSLTDMYWEDSENSQDRTFRVQPQKYGADFDPFEDELLLAVADRLDCAQAQAQRNSQKMEQLKSVQGFYKCSQLLLESVDKVCEDVENIAKSPTPAKTSISNGLKTQFDITESELLHFCAAAEEEGEVTEKGSVGETPPAKKLKSIVESILEDFCSSPLSPDGQEPHCSHINIRKNLTGQQPSDVEDRTPVFYFKNRPLRTYSYRRNKTGVRTSIAHRFESVALGNSDEDDNLSSCSSGLSVQEDLTQHTGAPLDSMEINKSTKVCENLLNLSAYFTQQSISDASPPSKSTEIYQTAQEECQQVDAAINTFEYYCTTAAQLIEQIIAMRKKHKCFFSEAAYSDIADFRGFPSATKEADETLLNSDAQKLNTTSFDYRNILDVTTLLHEDDCAADMIEDEIILSGSLTDVCSRDKNCPSSLKESLNRADELFSDSEDEWHDECDFFKHFKTQDALRQNSASNESTKHPASPLKKFNGFMSASRKPILISEGAQQKAARIFEEVDSNLDREFKASQKRTTCNISNIPVEAEELKELFFEENQNSPGFQAASNEQIIMSKNGEKLAQAVLSDLPVIPVSIKDNLDFVESSKFNTNNQNTCNAVNIDYVELGDIQLSEWLIDEGAEKNDNLTDMPAFKGFETASKKHIKISEAARKRALKILNDLPELPKSGIDENCAATSSKIPQDFKVGKSSKVLTKDANENNFPVCTGFHTASRKSINISVEAKERADKILETLPDFSNQKAKDVANAAEDLEGIQLSEWPLNDSFKNEIDETPLAITAKRKLSHITDDLEKYIQTPEKTAKYIGNSLKKKSLHRTPLTPHINNDSLGANNSSISQTKNTCLTSFAKSAIISRKNLLSLSKRKKMKYNQDIKTLEETLATPSAGHVVRMTTAPVTPNAQEFFGAVPNTSTPHPIRTSCTQTPNNLKSTEVSANPSEIDMDLKHIEWEAGNDSSTLNNTKTPSSSKFNSSCENITVISANPSPKMRIARLHMYGKPPPVSPILMSSTNNCRPSGLRRGRSMHKQ